MKSSKLLLTIVAATLIALGAGSYASQNPTQLPTATPYPGLTMLNNINSAFDTIITDFSGNSAPSSPSTWQRWLDTSNNLWKMYDGTSWLPIGKVSSHLFIPLAAGVTVQAPSSTGSSNAYVVTYSPAVTAYTTGIHYPFIANFANTSAATVNVNGLGAKALKKQGSVALASGDIPSGAVVDTVYDGTNLQMISQAGNSVVGTVTNVTCGTGLAGGSITTSGTCSVSTAAAATVMANITGSPAVPTGTSLAAVMDNATGTTAQGLYYRSSTGVATAPIGTSGNLYQSNGSGVAPSNISPANVGATEILLGTVAASNSPEVHFLSIPSGYDTYIVRFTNVVPATIVTQMNLQFSSNNGSGGWISSGYYYSLWAWGTTGGSGVHTGNNDTQFIMTWDGINTTTTVGASGEVWIHGLTTSGQQTFVNAHYTYYNVSAATVTEAWGGRLQDGGGHNSLRFYLSGGADNMITGIFSLYALRKQ